MASYATRTALSSLDIVLSIAQHARSPLPLVSLSRASPWLRRSTSVALSYALSYRRFLLQYFTTTTHILPLIDHGHVIFTGYAVFYLLSRLHYSADTLTAITTESSFPFLDAVLTHSGYVMISSKEYYPTPPPSRNAQPYVRAFTFHHPLRQLRIRVCVSAHSCLYGLLLQRSSMLLNGLGPDGFFSLYPAATFFARQSLLLRTDEETDAEYIAASRLIGVKVLRSAVPGVVHRTLMPAARRYGDKHTWIVHGATPPDTDPAMPHSGLRLNIWSLSEASAPGTSSRDHIESSFISAYALTSPFLDKVYLSSPFMKAFVSRILSAVQSAHGRMYDENNFPIMSWDAYIHHILNSLKSGTPFNLRTSPNGAIISFQMRLSAVVRKRLYPS